MLLYSATAIVGYLFGSFPTGVFITTRRYGIDVREMGSGNIGATNVTRVFGWYAGLLVFILDFAKGWLPLYLYSRYISLDPLGLVVLAGALVLGHCFSFYLKFNGGKGVATSFGCLAYVTPWAALICGLVYVSLLVATRISAVGSLGGLITALIYIAVTRPGPEKSTLIVGICLVVLIRHHENIKRLIATYQQRKGSRRK